MKKRSRKPLHPIEAANLKSDEDFLADYLQPCQGLTTWTHPSAGTEYTFEFQQTARVSDADLIACFDLIEETSGRDYRSSAVGWHPNNKMKEMRSPELRYVLVKREGQVRGFTSFMPTFEDGQPVIYCYEIHLKPDLQGSGLGKILMGHIATVAENVPGVRKVMLTCFVANEGGRRFYEKLGFERDEISPVERRLRFGKVVAPDYVILSRQVRQVGETQGG